MAGAMINCDMMATTIFGVKSIFQGLCAWFEYPKGRLRWGKYARLAPCQIERAC
jgi:hypothetical protein